MRMELINSLVLGQDTVERHHFSAVPSLKVIGTAKSLPQISFVSRRISLSSSHLLQRQGKRLESITIVKLPLSNGNFPELMKHTESLSSHKVSFILSKCKSFLDLAWVVNTPYRVPMMCCGIVHLQPV